MKWPFYSPHILEDLQRCMAHGDLGGVDGHPSVSAFEDAFRSTLESRAEVAFFNSGTSAYCAGLFALALPRGSEVIVPRQTFRASVTPLLQFGLVPRFASCSESLGTLTLDSVAASANDDCSAIVVTHQWGQPVEIDAIARFAKSRGLLLIEDCSHAHGGSYKGQPLGTFGDFSFFSCGTTKVVTGGTGGIFASSRRDLFERAILYGQPKHRCEASVSQELQGAARSGLGVNLRGSPLSAVLALDHLARLGESIRIRTANLRILDQIVADNVPFLTPVLPIEGWTAGTWYKRPFVRDVSFGERWLDTARTLGLHIRLQDGGLEKLLGPAQRLFREGAGTDVELPPAARNIVVFSALELYDPAWKPEMTAAALRKLVPA